MKYNMHTVQKGDSFLVGQKGRERNSLSDTKDCRWRICKVIPKNNDFWIPALLITELLCNFAHNKIRISTFANGEVKEFKEVREVKAICFTAKYSAKKAVGYNF